MFLHVAIRGVAAALVLCIGNCPSARADQVLMKDMRHLRSGIEREWDAFVREADGRELVLAFAAVANDQPWTLEFVQSDIKQDWEVSINGTRLGRLRIDENPMRVFYAIPRRCLSDGENIVRIACTAGASRPSDDIRVGRMVLHRQTRDQVVSESHLVVHVLDVATDRGLPSRLTIVDREGVLQETSASSNDYLAVRPGIVYTATGNAELMLPAGEYTIYAGRGFEYSLAREEVALRAGDAAEIELTLERQVSTEGLVACDPHVHTLTHSGHGDATVQERMITLAGEGIELPVATDHNVHVDYGPIVRALKLSEYFTPVMGNEVTTAVGHFNVFPVNHGARVPDHELNDWRTMLAEVFATPGVKIAILNHARDIHGNFRPFDPVRHYALVGENVGGWPMAFNAMEVVNSSATQTQLRTLFEDWLALLNRGYRITPVGSSDSHDVGRHFVGQGRTYIRGDDADVGRINLREVVDNFRQGQVAVSYGLLVEAQLEEKYGPGEVAMMGDGHVTLDCKVQAPDWIQPSAVELYMNGERVRTELISATDRRSLPKGVAWQGRWEFAVPSHDVCLVVMALGPGIEESYWRTAKPYQPVSTTWESHVFGCTGVIWIDADADGHWRSAHEYAQRAVHQAAADAGRLLELLTKYDEAVSLHAAHALRQGDNEPFATGVQERLRQAAPHVRRAFARHAAAWRATERARVESPPSF
jgi:hypothetical protein